MGKNLKGKTAVRVSTKERTDYTALALLIKQAKGTKNTSGRFPKLVIGWKKLNTLTCTMVFS